MAKIENKDIIEALKEKTILEVKELVDMMKEEFGVDPSAVAVAAAPAAGAAEDTGADAGVKTVVLKDAGAQKLQVIKVIREVTGLGLKEAKDIADAGGNVKEGIPAAEADELKAKLEEAGATVELA
jgi:large subunit ribosomal protein L7/L12